MTRSRLEAFSDAVIAIVMTIMVLELRAPHEASREALVPLAPGFFAYVLSFVNLGIYWNNHHHMFQAVERINGRILWANLHLLFWLSLFPFMTAWMGENDFASLPTATYGVVSLLAAIAYFILQTAIVAGTWARFEARKRLGPGSQGQELAGSLSIRDPAGVPQSLDLTGAVHIRGPDVAGARPSDRVHAARVTGPSTRCLRITDAEVSSVPEPPC